MADLNRRFFGDGPADFAVTIDGTTKALTVAPNADGTVYQGRTGSSTYTDLLDVSSAPITSITSDAEGRVAFYGPPGVTELYVDFGDGRFRLTGLGSATVTDPANAVWSPSDATGATDMTAELEAFRLANPGRFVRVQSGSTILLNGAFAAVTTGDILLDFTGCTVLYNASSTAGCAIKADNTGNASSEVTVNSMALAQVNSNAYVTQLTLAGTLAASRFEWLAVYSSDANVAHSGGYLGEICQVLNDEASLVVALNRKLNRHGSYTTTVKARKLNASRKLWIRGGTFKANGNTEDRSITTRADAIVALGWVDPLVEDVMFDHPWARGIKFQACAAPRWRNITVKDVGNLADVNGYVYGVVLYGMNDQADGRNTVVRNGRHPAFTTDGNTSSTTWWQKGIPTNAVIDSTHGYNCYGSVIDTHEEGDNIVFTNVSSLFAYQDADISQGAGFTGSAAQLRCANSTIKGLYVSGGTRGVRVNAVNHGFEDRVVLEDIRIENLTHSTDGDIGVQIDSQVGLANKRHVVLKGDFVNVGTALSVGAKAKVTVPYFTARACKNGLDAGAGSDIIFTGTPTFDYRNASRSGPYSSVKSRSDSTSGGASIIFMQPASFIRGTANTPAYFVEESDTIAPKNLWLRELIVADQLAVGPPAVVNTAATTFNAANVYKLDGFFTDLTPPGGGPVDPGPISVPQDLLPGLTSFELTLPTGPAGNPDDVYQTALGTYTDPTYFHLNTAKDGVEMFAPYNGTTTGGSSYARTELREMVAGYTTSSQTAAWDASDGQTHTLTVTQVVNQLPNARPVVITSQIHPAGSASFLFIIADGFRPASTTTAVTGTNSTDGFSICYKVNNSSGTQVEYAPILTNYKMGQVFTTKLEVKDGVVKIYCDFGNTATTLRATVTSNVPTGAVNYFKTGCYLQSNATNGGTVPSNTGNGGTTNLTSPAAGSTIPGDSGSSAGKVTMKALSVVHTTGTPPTGPVPTYPADLMGQFWKITLPTTPVTEVKQSDFATFSDPASFYLNTAKTGVVFSARCNAGTTSNSLNPRSELREMSGGPAYTTLAAWKTGTGTHTMIYTASVEEIPVKKPEVVVGQIHAVDDPPDDQLTVMFSGFYPTTGTVACTGTDTTIGVNLRLRWLGSVSLSGSLLPTLISDLHIGEKFSIKMQVTGNRYRVWAKKDPTGAQDFTGVAEATASVNLTYSYSGDNYFKLGNYCQSNTSNSGKNVPSGSCAGGANLTSPVAGTATGGDAATAGAKVTIWGSPTITHA